MRRPRGGFTLIELMLVIGIIALLAAILLPSFTHAKAQAQLTACQQNVASLAKALEAYANDWGEYPQMRRVLMPGYIGKIPTCPSTGALQYTILVNPAPQANYTVLCAGICHAPLAPLDYPRYTGDAGLEVGP